VASLWLALALWAAAAVSESRLFSQPALLTAAWVALFTLPPAYAMCRCGGLYSTALYDSLTPPSLVAAAGGLLHATALLWMYPTHGPVPTCCI
jgi:hypothetical protein